MTRSLRSCSVVVIFAALSGCAVVKSARVRPDWEQVDRQRVKRLVIVTHPYPNGEATVGELWSTIAARQIDLKRQFIIKDKLARGADEPLDPKSLCAEGVDGVLWLRPDVKRAGDGVEAAVKGTLLRCVDGEEVWAAEAAGSWNQYEEGLKETTASYVTELGESVGPYVPASYHLLQATLETLPDPVLTEDEKGEKIENTQ